MPGLLFQLTQRLNRFFHPSQRLVSVRRRLRDRSQFTGFAGEIFVPESPPKVGIPCGACIGMSRAQDEGAKSIGICAGLIDTHPCAPRGKRSKSDGMETEVCNLFGNQSIFTGMVGADLVEPAGRAGEIRLNHPMARTVGPSFIVIDMADRQIDDRRSYADREVHRPRVVGEEQLTARQQADKLIERRLAACIENRRRSPVGAIGLLGQLDGFSFGSRADQDNPHVWVAAQPCHRPAKVLRPPGFHDIAGSDLYGDPTMDGPVRRPKKPLCPGSPIGWDCDRQRREGAGTAPTHGIEIHQVEPVKTSMPMQVREVGQPGILHDGASVRPCGNPPQIRRADVGGK